LKKWSTGLGYTKTKRCVRTQSFASVVIYHLHQFIEDNRHFLNFFKNIKKFEEMVHRVGIHKDKKMCHDTVIRIRGYLPFSSFFRKNDKECFTGGDIQRQNDCGNNNNSYLSLLRTVNSQSILTVNHRLTKLISYLF
jgi:hypothetical protein